MQQIEKPGSFYLGKPKGEEKPLFYESKNLTTHAVCVGMTGSGKTGLGIALLEEAALSGLPALIIDPKGDMGNLMLTFPRLQGSDFLPWIDEAEAERKGETPEKYADSTATTWKEGLELWGEGGERIQRLKDKVDTAIYTPASEAGIPLSILNSFAAPPQEILLDTAAMRDRILTTTSSLLGLLGMDVDPIKSREHILISTLIEKAWSEKKDVDLPMLIQQIQSPPFEKIGVMPTESFFPEKERLNLSLRLNNLLASPGFKAWMQGEPLDIQSLLYTPQGKPRLAILTIAHLADSERMFFVTLLLNELVGWMRRQTGTSNLRALLYMDEIFGFFPPSAMPPSKMPMLTLLKQARAFGLGIVLATQNPVDLDYKGLSNCGTWFIGKLQTDRDRARVLEGISKESDRGDLNKMMAACGNRMFMLRSVYLPEPLLFQTRWTLSYLRGPLTLPQIETLMAGKIEKGPLKPSRAVPELKQKPAVPAGIAEFYMPVESASRSWIYQPKILGVAKLHFVDPKEKVDVWTQVNLVAPLSETGNQVAWEASQDTPYSKQAEPSAVYEELPASLMQAKNFASFSKAFAEYLYQNQTFDRFVAPEVKISSKVGESEEDFRKRVASASKEKQEADVGAIRQRYAAKIKPLQDRVQRAEGKTEVQKSQVWRQKLDTFIAVVTTLIGAFLGRGVSKTSVSQAGTSIRKAGRIGKEQEEVTRSEESLSALQQQLKELETEMENEVNQRLSISDPTQIALEKTSVRPRKSDIDIQQLALIWCPSPIKN
jgi:Helicase HerA, central domain